MLITIAEMVQPNIWEPPYLLKILDNLTELNDDYHFIISRTNTRQEILQFQKCIDKNKKNILILLSDEAGIVPPFIGDLYLVFRTYNKKSLYDNEKIFPIPCGYSFGHNNSFYKDFFKKSLIDRDIDIFYSAQTGTPDRWSCVENLIKIKDNFKSIVNITNGFAQGFKLEEYYSLMRNSKISIVPRGAVVPESFRYFESFESNSIVITTYPIEDQNYKHWYYNDSPAIFLSDWDQLTNDLIVDLLNIDKLKYYDIKNKEYFDKNISPIGVSNYMLNIIKNK